MGLSKLQLKKKHVNLLQNYDWPGNIRELQNVIERGVILSRGKGLLLDLPNRGSMFSSQSRQGPDIINDYTDKILTYSDLRIRVKITSLSCAHLQVSVAQTSIAKSST